MHQERTHLTSKHHKFLENINPSFPSLSLFSKFLPSVFQTSSFVNAQKLNAADLFVTASTTDLGTSSFIFFDDAAG